jgi:hypothetical protein
MPAVASARARWKRRPAPEWRLKRYVPLAATANHDSRNPQPRARMVREADRLVHGEYSVADMCPGDEIGADYHAARPAGELSERSRCASVRGGEVPEWSIGAVSKAVVLLAGTVGSNPTLSASRTSANVRYHTE